MRKEADIKPKATAGTLAVVLALASSPLWAIDLYGAWQEAHDHAPGLQAAAAARAAASESRPLARAGLLPNLALSANVTRTQYDPRTSGPTTYSTNKSYAISLSQPLYRRDRWIALEQADSQVRQAEAEYAAAEQQLMLDVASRYFDVLAAQDNLRFARAEKKAIARQLEQAKQRFKVGLSAITDVHEAQARYDLAVSAVIAAENRLDSAREALRELVGPKVAQDALAPLVAGVPLRKPDPPDMQAWVKRAVEGNLQLRALRAAVESARREVERQRAGHYPTLDAQASFTYQDANFGGVFPLKRNDSAIGLQLRLPLYAGGAIVSATRQAADRYEEAREKLEQQRLATERAVRDAYRGVISGIAQVRAMEQALRSTETALEAAQAGFEVGTRTIVDVLDAQREKYRARRDLARARYDYLLSTLRLKQAVGSLAPEDLERISRWMRQADDDDAS
ncbi:MAG: type I secretion protein TolC [Gammaproteobacteria bacterium]|nr:MAG: type I secretion protein TolC [Gammaproteobacteria bacterium]